jgi:hypothetical protein
MKRLLVIIPALLFSVWNADAQAPEKMNPHYAISIHPWQFIIRGQRVDLEKRVKDSRHWIIAGPQIYSGTINYRRNSFEDGEQQKLSGFGLELQHKIMMDSGKAVYTYVTYGAAFHKFTIGYESPSWVTVQDDGLTYYKYAIAPQKEKIYRWSGLVTAGMFVPLSRYFFMDLYTGIGMRNSTIKATTPNYPDYDGFLNYGFTGVYPIAGMKLGVAF